MKDRNSKEIVINTESGVSISNAGKSAKRGYRHISKLDCRVSSILNQSILSLLVYYIL